LFAWLPHDIVKKTFDIMTQYAHLPYNTVLQKHFKSPNPALNVQCHNEDITAGTIESNVPAIDGGQKYAQIFIGITSLLTDIYSLKSISMFSSILSDHIIDHSTPTCLLSNIAKVEMSKHVKYILRTYGMGCRQSEPYHQHQNPAKRQYQDMQHMCNIILDQTGAPAYCWLLCPMYSGWFLTCLTLTTSRPPLCNLHSAQPMTSAASFTSLSTNQYTTIWVVRFPFS
jgi:hypothetical protein